MRELNDSLHRSRLEDNLSEDAKRLRDDLEERNRSLSKQKEQAARESIEERKS